MASIPLDSIFSDPLLSAGAGLFLLGPIIFLFALVKFIKAGKAPARRMSNFVVPNTPTRASNPLPPKPEPPMPPEPEIKPEPVKTEAPAPPPPAPAPAKEPTGEKTTILSPEFSDLQGQIEICMTQIKTLNKKIFELERAIEVVEKHQAVDLQESDLGSTPQDPKDFMKKILKLAEHVIVLEKGFEEIKRQRKAAPTPASAPAKPQPSSTPQEPASGQDRPPKPPMPL